MKNNKIRPVCLTMSTKDQIQLPNAITEKDLRQTASIIGSFILADRKHKIINRREKTNLIIIGPVCHRFFVSDLIKKQVNIFVMTNQREMIIEWNI